MPSLLVPTNYHILEKSSGGWIPMSKCLATAGCISYAWSGQGQFVPITVVPMKTEHENELKEQNMKLLLFDSVTLLGAGEDTDTVKACYTWQLPFDKTEEKKNKYSLHTQCTCKDHRIAAIKDIARRHVDVKSKRVEFIFHKKRFDQILALFSNETKENLPCHPIGKASVGIFEDDLPVSNCSFNKLCERCFDACGKTHMRHYVETCLLLKGNPIKKSRTKHAHIEITDEHLPVKTWRKLRRAISVCGLKSVYSLKVRNISLGKRNRRRMRVRFQNPSSISVSCCSSSLPSLLSGPKYSTNVKENVFVENIKSITSNVTLQSKTWVKIQWKDKHQPIVIEGIQIWPHFLTTIQ